MARIYWFSGREIFQPVRFFNFCDIFNIKHLPHFNIILDWEVHQTVLDNAFDVIKQKVEPHSKLKNYN